MCSTRRTPLRGVEEGEGGGEEPVAEKERAREKEDSSERNIRDIRLQNSWVAYGRSRSLLLRGKSSGR
jgi:hypothetical protein